MNSFIIPQPPGPASQFQDDLVFTEGQQVELQWTTNYSTFTVVWWQNLNSSYQLLDDLDYLSGISSYNWKVNITGHFDLADGNVFFFQLWDYNSWINSSAPRTVFNSHYFNISAASSVVANTTTSSSSVLLPIATGTASSSSTSSSAPTSSTSARPAAVSQQDHTRASSYASQIALVVCLALGLALTFLASVLFLVLHRRRRARQREEQQQQQQQTIDPPHDWTMIPSGVLHLPLDGPPAELHETGVVEMGSEARAQEMSAEDPSKGFSINEVETGHTAGGK